MADLPVAEQELSHLLNNAKIIRGSHHRTVLAKHYLKELWRLAISIKRHLNEDGGTHVNADLSDVHIVVEWFVLLYLNYGKWAWEVIYTIWCFAIHCPNQESKFLEEIDDNFQYCVYVNLGHIHCPRFFTKSIAVAFYSAQGPLMLNAEGRVQVPSFTPGFLVLDFLNQHTELICNPQKQRL